MSNKKIDTRPIVIKGQDGKKVAYQGNPRLKRDNIQIEWTLELIEEYARCAEDPIYFIENYVKIITKDRGLQPLKLYDYQREMILHMKEGRFCIFATSRQAGKSTTTTSFILWYILFHSDQLVAILANKAEIAQEIFAKVRLSYMYLPHWLQQGVLEWNKRSIELENNSRVIATATSSDAIRGFSVNLLFLDECAHIDKWQDFSSSVMPTISSGTTTKIIMVSTPNGLNHFWNYWDNAKRGINGYRWVEVPWWRVPLDDTGRMRDEAWKQTALADVNYDMEKFRQEYEVQFLGSSGTLISGWKLQQLHATIPIADQSSIKQYALPEKDHAYVIVADVSEGRGLDYSAFHVLDITTIPYSQVCVFKDNLITPYDYAEVIYRTAKSYNNAYVLVETNGIGAQVSDSMYFDFEYEYLFTTESAGRIGKRISSGFGAKTMDRGVKTTKLVKSIGCAIAKLLIEQDKLVINDKDTIFELSTFSRKGKSYEAEDGKNDDLVMGIVLFGWLSDQGFFQELNNINTLAALREKTSDQVMDDLLPFGFIDDHVNDLDEHRSEIDDISTGKHLDDWF